MHALRALGFENCGGVVAGKHMLPLREIVDAPRYLFG